MPSPQLNDNEKRPLLQPNPFPQNSIRLKLLALVGMLAMVIFAMYEAGKPENWEWMGFDKQAEIRLDANPESPNDALSTKRSGDRSRQPKTNSSRSSDDSTPKAISLIPDDSTITPPRAIVNQTLGNATLDYPEAAIRFWEETYPELKRDSQKAIMQLMKEIRTGQPSKNRSDEHTRRALALIIKRRSYFHQELFDRLTLTPDSSPNKKTLSERYHASEEIWVKRTLPALVAAAKGEPTTDEHKQVITQLQPVLDELAYQQVEDRTTIGWAGDSEAWKRIWERVISNQVDSSSTPVERIQLIGQPESFRGKYVAIKGTVLSGRKEVLPEDTALGIHYRYELWLRPDDSGAGPYCLYATTLPDGFPKLNKKFQNMEEPISAEGIFFKVRSFNAASGDVDYSPVIISRSFTRAASAIAREESASQDIPWNWLIAATFFLPVVASFIAWMAYRLAEVDRHPPGNATQSRIENSLQVLKKDPDIETDLERVQRLGKILDDPTPNANASNEIPNEASNEAPDNRV